MRARLAEPGAAPAALLLKHAGAKGAPQVLARLVAPPLPQRGAHRARTQGLTSAGLVCPCAHVHFEPVLLTMLEHKRPHQDVGRGNSRAHFAHAAALCGLAGQAPRGRRAAREPGQRRKPGRHVEQFRRQHLPLGRPLATSPALRPHAAEVMQARLRRGVHQCTWRDAPRGLRRRPRVRDGTADRSRANLVMQAD